MVLHQIDDIRRFYSSDLTALQQSFIIPPLLAAIIAVTTTQIRCFFAKAKGTLNKTASDTAAARY